MCSWGLEEELGLGFFPLLAPSSLFYFLSFLLVACFDDVCMLRCKMLLGMPVAIQMPEGKTFCRELLKVLLK